MPYLLHSSSSRHTPKHSIPHSPTSARFAESIKSVPRHSSQASKSRTSNTSRFPPLPNEITHRIFHIAAVGDPDTCRALCMVSSWARLMVLPFRMSTVVIRNHDHWLLQLIGQRFPRDDWVSPSHFVKNLWIHRRISIGSKVSDWVHTHKLNIDFRRLLFLCPQVTNFSASSSSVLALVTQGALQFLDSPITTLTVLDIFDEIAAHPDLQSMYSLVLDLTIAIHAEGAVDLSGFRRMTHLNLNLCQKETELWGEIFDDLHRYTQLHTINIGLPAPPKSLAGRERYLVDRVEQARQSDSRLSSPTFEILMDIPSWKVKVSRS